MKTAQGKQIVVSVELAAVVNQVIRAHLVKLVQAGSVSSGVLKYQIVLLAREPALMGAVCVAPIRHVPATT